MRVTLMTFLALLATSAAHAGDAHGEDSYYAFFLADRLEYHGDDDSTRWDLQGWYGGDRDKFWWKLEGAATDATRNELQLLYSRAVSPFFDLQLGAALLDDESDTQSALVVGMQGMAPYGLEADAAILFADDGEVSLRSEIERDWYLSQRLVLQPRLEFSITDDGDKDLDIGVRLRYEITRKIAPYLGVRWETNDETDTEDASVLVGMRFWF